MRHIRPPAVAGLFYPQAEAELRQGIVRYLQAVSAVDLGSGAKAIIVPHAGYVYSGPVAAAAFQCLARDSGTIRRIVLLGPAHRLVVRGLALPGQDAFETPLGVVEVDRELIDRVQQLAQISTDTAAHAPEHCLEVELPFLQETLGSFAVLPLLVSDASPDAVAEVLECVWGGDETRIVVSSDLSHYLSYEAAGELDRETAGRIVRLDGPIEPFRACGAVAINGLLEAARRHGLGARLLDLRNSGDTAGDRMRVVGYGSFSFATSM